MREVCDLAYVLLLDQVERQTLADRQVAAVFIAAGEKNVDLPTFTEQRQLLDELLEADLRVADEGDSEQLELRRALGVA